MRLKVIFTKAPFKCFFTSYLFAITYCTTGLFLVKPCHKLYYLTHVVTVFLLHSIVHSLVSSLILGKFNFGHSALERKNTTHLNNHVSRNYTCFHIRNLKQSSIDVQQNYVSKKGINVVIIWGSFHLFFEIKTSGPYLWFMIRKCI